MKRNLKLKIQIVHHASVLRILSSSMNIYFYEKNCILNIQNSNIILQMWKPWIWNSWLFKKVKKEKLPDEPLRKVVTFDMPSVPSWNAVEYKPQNKKVMYTQQPSVISKVLIMLIQQKVIQISLLFCHSCYKWNAKCIIQKWLDFLQESTNNVQINFTAHITMHK
jgi:hypothetical protein